MSSDFGPSPGLRGCVFPEDDTDHGWDNNYLWADLLNLSAGEAFWWTAWRYAFPDIPDQWRQYVSEDVITQLGGRTHLEHVSHPSFEPTAP